VNLRDAIFDRYSIMARQRPALLMLFPALVGMVVMLPSLQSWWATLLAVTGTCGVSMALAEFAQEKGKALERMLISRWDKLPSVAMLRHRDIRLDSHTKCRYKVFLAAHIPGLIFPDTAAEAANPAAADDAYQSATNWLLARTRDKKMFGLLFEQNISYGFRRNMLGLRLFGVGISLAVLAATIIAAIHQIVIGRQIDSTLVFGAFVALAALSFWSMVVKSNWVEAAATAYARELLAACDSLMEKIPVYRPSHVRRRKEKNPHTDAGTP
jgi:hypothetical protein